MNPYETAPQTPMPKPNPLATVKKVAFFAIIVIFFTGCFKIAKGIPITDTTTFTEMKSVSLFHAIFVLPMAKLVIGLYTITGSAFLAISLATIINRVLGTLLTGKSTLEAEKMKELQPQMNAINAKYLGRKDQASMMAKNAEMQKLFQKHNVDPMGSIGSMFIALPLFMSIYVAIKDNAFLGDKILLGVKTSTITSAALKANFNLKIAIAIVMLVGFQFLSIKIPGWLSNQRSKSKIKAKESDMQRNMAIMLPVMMLLVSWNVTIALLVYFSISPIFSIFQSLAIHRFVIVKEQKKSKSVNKLY